MVVTTNYIIDGIINHIVACTSSIRMCLKMVYKPTSGHLCDKKMMNQY